MKKILVTLLALTLINCNSSPSVPEIPHIVSTAYGDVLVLSEVHQLSDSELNAIRLEVEEGYRDGLRIWGEPLASTDTFTVRAVDSTGPDYAGIYIPYYGILIAERPLFRAIDDDLQHHFCYERYSDTRDC